MKEKYIKKKSKIVKSRTDWKKLVHGRDQDIDYSDIPVTDKQFWSNAEIVYPGNKVPLSIRFDQEVIQWFRRQGPGYQTRMNAVLKGYIQAMQKRGR